METVYILLSTFNGQKFLDEQIDSLYNQKNISTHLIIRDDGSSDDTVAIIEKWVNKYPSWITFLKGNNIGFACSFANLVSNALNLYPKAQYFAFCDQDDVWLPDKLYKAVNILSKLPSTVPTLYFSNSTVVDSNLEPICLFWRANEVRPSKEGALIQNFAQGCTEVFNRHAASMFVDHFTEDVKLHDYFIYLQCIFLGKVIYDENSYLLYRQHGNNQIGKKTKIRKIVNLFRSRILKGDCYNRCYLFLETYKTLLSTKDILMISVILNYKKSLLYKLALLFNSKFKYTNYESNTLLKIKIILNWL